MKAYHKTNGHLTVALKSSLACKNLLVLPILILITLIIKVTVKLFISR